MSFIGREHRFDGSSTSPHFSAASAATARLVRRIMRYWIPRVNGRNIPAAVTERLRCELSNIPDIEVRSLTVEAAKLGRSARVTVILEVAPEILADSTPDAFLGAPEPVLRVFELSWRHLGDFFPTVQVFLGDSDTDFQGVSAEAFEARPGELFDRFGRP